MAFLNKLKGYTQTLRSTRHQSSSSGLSLIELAVLILVMAILSTGSVVAFGNLDETTDANLVATVQSSLQSVVGQGAARLSITPAAVVTGAGTRNSVMNAVASRFPAGAITMASPGISTFQLNLPTGRSATYNVAPNGTVTVTGIANFPNHAVSNGTIQ